VSSTGGSGSRIAFDAGAMYDEAPCGLVSTSADGLILHANRTFCRWLGQEPTSLVGLKKFQDLLTKGGQIYHQTHWAPLLAIQGFVTEVKLDVVHGSGRTIPIVLNAVRRESGGSTRHELAIFVAEDRHRYEQELLRARKQAEDLLRSEQQAQRDLAATEQERDRQRAVAEDRALFAEQMVGIVSHDLRNPLSVIRTSAHVLGLGELSSTQQRALDQLLRSTLRAGRLISDLLDFTQARLGGGLKISLAPIDLHAIVADAVEELRLAFPDRRILHHRSGAGVCEASADRLVQMIGNLVGNALTHGAVDGTVTVTSAVAESTFTVAVHNHGRPIPEAALPTLFEPMTRGRDEDDLPHGVGLGLFIVAAIVRAHRGRIDVQSSLEGGTTFVGEFPRGPR
jgi:phosphoserine phosphatase RsbU/P